MEEIFYAICLIIIIIVNYYGWSFFLGKFIGQEILAFIIIISSFICYLWLIFKIDQKETNRNGYDWYDRDWYHRDWYDREGYDRDWYNRDWYDREGYDRDWYDQYWYDRDWYDKGKAEHDPYDGRRIRSRDRDWYDRNWYDRDWYDREGYDRDWYNRNWYDQYWYDREGYDKFWYNKNLFNKKSIHKYTRTYRDKEWFDQQGYDKDGYYRNGYDKEWYDRNWLDVWGYNKKWHKNWFNKDWIHKDTNTFRDKEWFNEQGFDKNWFDKKGFDKKWFNRDGFNKKWFDKLGFDKKWFNSDGFDKNWYDKLGYDKDWFNKLGFDKDWYDREGYDNNRYDREGYDPYWYDRDWYNKEGYDEYWFNRKWFNQQWYDRSGFNVDGFNADGYNRNGFNKLENNISKINEEPHQQKEQSRKDISETILKNTQATSILPSQNNKAKTEPLKLFFFDTETTGIDSWKDYIIQFGGIFGEYDLDTQEFRELTVINQYINLPDSVQIPIWASKVHGIYKENLAGYHQMSYYIKDFLKYMLKTDFVIGHNVEFDKNMIIWEAKRNYCSFDPSKIKWLDTMKPCTWLIPTIKSNKRPKLQELHTYLFGVPFDWAHDAMADIRATKDCFLKLIETTNIYDEKLGLEREQIRWRDKLF